MSGDVPQPRRVAGRYVLRGVLGRGGMGTVYRARDEVLEREVAVKEIRVTGTATAEEGAALRARVLREARAAARVHHDGAVTVHDVVEDGESVDIVMELVEAPTLARLVADGGPLDPARTARIGRQVLDVLDSAHAAGVVHRDVKPANVMVLPGDLVKVADFGIAAVRDDPKLTASGAILGSPSFMAPEQAGGRPVGPAADIWSLGATLYDTVEGRPPYRGENAVAVLAGTLTRDPDPPVRAGALGPVLLAMLAREPDARPSPDDLRRSLDAIGTGPAEPSVTLADTGPVPSPPPASERPPVTFLASDAKRRLVLLTAVPAAVVVAVALVLWFATRPGAAGTASGTPTTRAGTTRPAAAAAPATSGTPAPGSTKAQGGDAGGAVRLDVATVAPGGQVLPRFWASATNPAGRYSIGVPASFWLVTAEGTSTYAEWPGATFGAAFEVHQYAATTEPYRLLRRQAAAFAREHAGDRYAVTRLDPSWTYRNRPAAAWEYTWVRNGEPTHALVVAFRAGAHTYTVLYRSKELWWNGGGTAEFPAGFETAFTPAT